MSKAGITLATADPSAPAVRPTGRRGVELALIVLAVGLSVYGYCAVGLARNGTVPPGAAGYGAGLGVLAVLAHLAVRWRAPLADPLPLPIGVLLNGVGLVLIYRLDLETPGDRAAPAQLIWSTLGVALFIAVILVLRDHRVLQRYTYLCVTVALVLLTVPILFPAVNGARIWIRVAGFSIQPGEFAKVLLAVFFAAYLAANRSALTYAGRRVWGMQLPTGRVLGPIVAVWLVSVGVLVLERDLGTSLLFFGLFVVLLYVATGRTGWIAVGLLLASLGAVAVGRLEPHVHHRIETWLRPFASIEAGEGPNQIAQSLFAFAEGGILGSGLGLGHSVLIGFAVKSDFILATAGEELGLAGLSAIILLYGLLVERGFRAGLALRDPFGRLLAVGLASLVALQVFVIAGGVTGLTTAVVLAERGVRVRLWTRDPVGATTSAVAGALWWPYRIDPPEAAQAWALESLGVYEEMALRPEATGVRMVEGVLGETPMDEVGGWAAARLPGLRPVTESEYPGGWGLWARLPLIDMPAHLPYLRDRLTAAGGTVETRAVADLAEADAPVVVNCTGLAARELVPDPSVRPVRGQLVVVENPGIRTWMVTEGADGSMAYFFPQPGRLLLGGTAEEDVWSDRPDPAAAEAIVRRCAALRPEIAGARVLEHRVGLRPARDAVRLERTRLPDGRVLVHNYGHGGAGVTVAWGCAREAAGLAAE